MTVTVPANETRFLERLIAEYEAAKGTHREAYTARRVEAQRTRIATIKRGPVGQRARTRI